MLRRCRACRSPAQWPSADPTRLSVPACRKRVLGGANVSVCAQAWWRLSDADKAQGTSKEGRKAGGGRKAEMKKTTETTVLTPIDRCGQQGLRHAVVTLVIEPRQGQAPSLAGHALV